jgi:CRISPR-associated protein Cas2
MFYLVSYDIPDTPRRTKIAKILDDFGDRVQYSVFECIIDQDLLEKMIDRLEKVVKLEEDSVRIYALCGNCEKVIKVIGQGEVTKEEKYYIL